MNKPDPIATATAKLDELFSEVRQIDDRIAGITKLKGKIRNEIDALDAAIRRENAGGILDPPAETVAKRNELRKKLTDLDGERAAIKKRKEKIRDEAVAAIRSALRPAWKRYVQARESEIDAALKAVPRVYKALESFFQASKARREADGAFGHLLGQVEVIAGGQAKMRVAGELRRETPEPLRPTDTPNVDFETRRNWLASLELRRVFSSKYWTDPQYNIKK